MILLEELKIRARVRLNASRRNLPKGETHAELRLKDCLNQVSRAVGFANWDRARVVLGGGALPGDDFGSFWYSPSCRVLLNQWFAKYEDAQRVLNAAGERFLLPYRKQYIVVEESFIRELGLNPSEPAWTGLNHDVVSGYGSSWWESLALNRLRAPDSTFE